MVKYYLFLDDVRQPQKISWVNIPQYSWTIVRNYTEFCDVIKNNGIPEFVCYDHDLAYEHYNNCNSGGEINYNDINEKTGYDCAKFLCNECSKLNIKHPPFVVHSMNIIGKQNIESYIESFNKINF